MDLSIKKDYILSFTNKDEYILIADIKKNDKIEYLYEAQILEYHFLPPLKMLINEYWEYVDLFSKHLVHHTLKKMKDYDLRLKNNDIKIFELEIKEQSLTFFTKYPTPKGFLDDYPDL